jgi:hypothetical protein
MFGETVAGFDVPVLNEREVRAGAGILFFVTIVVFLGAWHADLMLPAQLMIIAFFGDFAIRVFAPRYSPSLILGRLAVSGQKPEYTAAAPKRFAWLIGLSLASFMLVSLVFMRNMSIVNFSICGVCIVLLFMESSFGICLGCVIYNKVLKREVALCAGGICEVRQKEAIERVSVGQVTLLVAFAIAMLGVVQLMQAQNNAHDHSGPNHQLIQDMKGASGGSAPAPDASMPGQRPMAPAADPHAHHRQ